jgi:hypothetical protein
MEKGRMTDVIGIGYVQKINVKIAIN